MSHKNAALTPRHRLKVAQLVVDQGWPISEAAARFQVSWPTAKRWVDRYRAGEPMHDRSSRPHLSPSKTPPRSSSAVSTCGSDFAKGRCSSHPGSVSPHPPSTAS